MERVARRGKQPAGQDVHLVLLDELPRLGEGGRRVPLRVLHDQLDLPPAHLGADPVQVELGAVQHVLAQRRRGAGERRQETDLDGPALRRRRAGGGERRGERHAEDGGQRADVNARHRRGSPPHAPPPRGGARTRPAPPPPLRSAPGPPPPPTPPPPPPPPPRARCCCA